MQHRAISINSGALLRGRVLGLQPDRSGLLRLGTCSPGLRTSDCRSLLVLRLRTFLDLQSGGLAVLRFGARPQAPTIARLLNPGFGWLCRRKLADWQDFRCADGRFAVAMGEKEAGRTASRIYSQQDLLADFGRM